MRNKEYAYSLSGLDLDFESTAVPGAVVSISTVAMVASVSCNDRDEMGLLWREEAK